MLKRTIAKDLSEFAYGLRYADLPVNVADAVKRLLFDSVGCAYGASRLRETALLRDAYAGNGGRPDATVIGFGDRVPCSSAAVINAHMTRLLDFDGIYWRSDACSPSILMAAALACGESVGATMDDVLATIVLGYEVLTRMAECAVPPLRDRGWHRSTLVGFAAPLVAGRALGMSTDQMVAAMALGGARAPTLGCVAGPRGGTARFLAEALAVESGVWAAQLARRGVAAPDGVFEGKSGLFESIGGRWAEERLTQGLGRKWKILDVTMKAWPVEILMHTPLTAMAQAIKDHPVNVEEIESITIITMTRTREIMFPNARYEVDSRESAAQSLPFCLAVMAIDGRLTTQSFQASRFKDPRVVGLMAKIRAESSREYDRAFPERQAARVTIRARGGAEWVSSVDHPRGDPRSPMTMDDVTRKFSSLAQGVVPPESIELIREKVMSCERLKASAFMDALSFKVGRK